MTTRRLMQLEYEAQRSVKKIKIQVSDAYGATATATATKRDPEEWVDIYMINAGSGDAFYLHFKRKDYQTSQDGTVTEIFYEATMIIDGGHGAQYGQLMWHEIATVHLPTQPNPTIDLVINAHQDADHIGGLIWMYDRMSQGLSLGPPGTVGIYPSMTWLNPAYVARKRSVPEDAGAIDDLTDTIQDLSITTDPQPWPSKSPGDRERSGAQAQALINFMKPTWGRIFAPTPGTPPQKIEDAGANVFYRAPTAEQVRTAEQVPGDGRIVNSASIVNEIVATNPEHYWDSLWTGDAYDTSTYPSIRDSIFLFEGARRHYTIVKVGHHGSGLSNSKEFFAAVTADHYLISSNYANDNSRQETIQWILDRHSKMRARQAAATPAIMFQPPRIWVCNPINQTFAFDFKGGEILQRNCSIDGINLSAKGTYGYLYFQIHNGAVVTTPNTHMITQNLSNPNDPTRSTVVPFTNQKQISMRAAIPNAYVPWTSILPDDRTYLAPEEIQDLDANAQAASLLRVICSQPYGDLLQAESGIVDVVFLSDLGTICRAGQLPKVRRVTALCDPTTPRTSFQEIICDDGSGAGLGHSVTMDAQEYVNSIDVWSTTVGIWSDSGSPGGLTMYTNRGRSLVLGSTQGEVEKQFRPPNSSYGLVRFRTYGFIGEWAAYNQLRAGGIVGRLGVIWAPMLDP